MSKIRFAQLLLIFFIGAPALLAQGTTVQWNTTYQTMEGWGASTWYYNLNSYSATQAANFWSPSTGIGLEFIKSASYPDSNATPDPTQIPDLAWVQGAVANGAKVFVGMSCPPNAYMSDGNECSKTNTLSSAHYTDYANYIVNHIKAYQNNNISVYAVSVQNEPDQTGISSAVLDTFVANYLGPAMCSAGMLNVAGCSSTSPILMELPEDGGWFNQDYITTCMNDANCKKYIGRVASHDYGPPSATWGFTGTGSYCCASPANPPSSVPTTIPLWMTEVNGGFSAVGCNGNLWTFDASMADALVWAHNMWGFLTIPNNGYGVSAYFYWELWGISATEGLCNDGLTDNYFNPAKRFYMFGNWSKYVRPGWLRIGATANPASGIYVTAFKDPSSGKFAIVAVNQNSSSSNMTFSLDSFPSVSSVTPTVTSESTDLADQANISVSSGSFSYSLPATSVVTFHGTASSSTSQNPAAPTNLTATVH